MRYGYFLALRNERCGDPTLSTMAQNYWERSGHTSPGRFDGVSIWGEDEGSAKVRVVARDLFGVATVRFPPAPQFEINKYVVHDVPTPTSDKGEGT